MQISVARCLPAGTSVCNWTSYPTDPPHAVKTCRNQLQHASSTESGFLVNRLQVVSGLVLKDIENIDKQDDGAARRVFHVMAFETTTVM